MQGILYDDSNPDSAIEAFYESKRPIFDLDGTLLAYPDIESNAEAWSAFLIDPQNTADQPLTKLGEAVRYSSLSKIYIVTSRCDADTIEPGASAWQETLPPKFLEKDIEVNASEYKPFVLGDEEAAKDKIERLREMPGEGMITFFDDSKSVINAIEQAVLAQPLARRDHRQ